MVSVMYCAVAAHAAMPDDEAREKKCPEGQYSGPRAGARSFYRDPYVWFLSREFAQRFCFPESYIDDSLTGALAIAVRIKPEEFELCGFMGGPGQCPQQKKLLIDLYVDNKKTHIPKADPNVHYYGGVVQNSGWLAANISDRRRHGGAEVEGQKRPFMSLDKNEEELTKFLYVAERKGWASMEGVFGEAYYRENWVGGIDLITLNGYNFGYSEARNPDAPPDPKDPHYLEPVKRFAIAVLLGSERSPYGNAWEANDWYKKNVRYPQGYRHVIEVPHRLAQIIYAYDHQQGEQFMKNVQDAMRSLAPSKP